VVLHEEHEMIPLVINSFRLDLESRNDTFVCLALAAVCNIGGKGMAEAMAPVVEKLLISAASSPMIRKKAAMCLMRLYQRYPEIITTEVWVDRFREMLANEIDLGVLSGYISLLTHLTGAFPEVFNALRRSVLGVVARIIIERRYNREYIYYKVANPWVQVKLFKLLQMYPTHDLSDAETAQLKEILGKVMAAVDVVKQQSSQNQRNAFNAVFFEAVNLIIYLRNDLQLLSQVGQIVGGYLTERQSNLRYLSLEAMTRFAAIGPEAVALLTQHQAVITQALEDPDISIRKRALDLLYNMCDRTNCETIVGELLKYLHRLNSQISADLAIREELVLKIAILAEKYATRYKWYVDVMLQLVTMAGDAMSDEIWYRAVRLITNHEDIQQYAAEVAWQAVRSDLANETTVKVAAYILGEYGDLICDQPDSAGDQQFAVLWAKFTSGAVGDATKAILLSTFIKFCRMYPPLIPRIGPIFKQHATQIDPEIQQRSVEYLGLLALRNIDLLNTICDVMPPYAAGDEDNEEVSGDVSSGPDLIASAVAASTSPRPASARRDSGASVKRTNSSSVGATSSPQAIPTTTTPRAVPTSPSMVMSGSPATPPVGSPVGSPTSDSLAAQNRMRGQSVFGEGVNKEFNQAISAASGQGGSDLNSMRLAPPPEQTLSHLSPEERKVALAMRVSLQNQGVLLEDDMVQIGFKAEWQRGQGRMMLYLGNKTATSFTGAAVIVPPVGFVAVQIPQKMSPIVDPGTQQKLMLQFVSQSPFSAETSLPITLSFIAQGKGVQHKIDLPLNVTRFVDPVTLDGPKYFGLWAQLAQPPLAAQDVFPAAPSVTPAALIKFLGTAVRVQPLAGLDPNANNVVASGVFSCASLGQLAVLIRLETNPQAQAIRLSVRTANAVLTQALLKTIKSQISGPAAQPNAAAAPASAPAPSVVDSLL
jgi:AP-2 complex subunit alpha